MLGGVDIVLADHGIGLSGCSLAVEEDVDVGAIEECVDVLLRCLLVDLVIVDLHGEHLVEDVLVLVALEGVGTSLLPDG